MFCAARRDDGAGQSENCSRAAHEQKCLAHHVCPRAEVPKSKNADVHTCAWWFVESHGNLKFRCALLKRAPCAAAAQMRTTCADEHQLPKRSGCVHMSRRANICRRAYVCIPKCRRAQSAFQVPKRTFCFRPNHWCPCRKEDPRRPMHLVPHPNPCGNPLGLLDQSAATTGGCDACRNKVARQQILKISRRSKSKLKLHPKPSNQH